MPIQKYHDHFDLLTIRHDLIKDINHVDTSSFQKYKKISDITATKLFNTHRGLFFDVGFEMDDVKSLSSIYLVSYLANYQKDGGFHKNRNVLINFLRQKLYNLIKVCVRKNRNVICNSSKGKFFMEVNGIMEKISYRDYKKNINKVNVEYEQRLNENDYISIMNLNQLTPEEILIQKESNYNNSTIYNGYDKMMYSEKLKFWKNNPVKGRVSQNMVRKYSFWN